MDDEDLERHLYVADEKPDGWLAGAMFALLIGGEFALFTLAGDPSYWVVAAPLLILGAYYLRRAWTAHRDVRILRAQELAGGLQHTALRTRRQRIALAQKRR